MSISQENDSDMIMATHHRDQLRAIAERFVQRHSYEFGECCEADELAVVILDGANYTAALQRVMGIIKARHEQ